MKLVFPEFETPLHFAEGSFPSVVIENHGLFYRFVEDLHRQTCGEEGVAVLSSDDEPIPFPEHLDLVTEFFPFAINRKALLNKVIAELGKRALAPEFYARSQQLFSQVENLIRDLAFLEDLELDLPPFSAGALLKAAGVSLKEDYPSLAEKMLVYMDLMTGYGLAEVFVFVNLRCLLEDSVMELFTDSCCRKGYDILLVDSHAYSKLARERRTVIDAELCEF